MRNLIKTLVLFLMLSFSHSAIAGDFEDGVAATQNDDFATELRLLKPLAEQGNAFAQFNLAQLYNEGLGVAQTIRQLLSGTHSLQSREMLKRSSISVLCTIKVKV